MIYGKRGFVSSLPAPWCMFSHFLCVWLPLLSESLEKSCTLRKALVVFSVKLSSPGFGLHNIAILKITNWQPSIKSEQPKDTRKHIKKPKWTPMNKDPHDISSKSCVLRILFICLGDDCLCWRRGEGPSFMKPRNLGEKKESQALFILNSAQGVPKIELDSQNSC